MEKERGYTGVLWLLVLGCTVGGFGYSLGYAKGQGRAIEQADERISQIWELVTVDGRGGEKVDEPAEDSSSPLRSRHPAPASNRLGAADSYPTVRADS